MVIRRFSRLNPHIRKAEDGYMMLVCVWDKLHP